MRIFGKRNEKAVLLTLRNYKKSYNDSPILTVESLDVPTGTHWFEGSNGSGKSTFFKTIAGIIPFTGEMSVTEIPNNQANSVIYRRLVNYAYAEPQFPDYLSGADIISFVQETRNADKNQVVELVKQFGVNDFYKNAMQTYSSGMLKKISLIMAFIGQPQLIMLDEPFTTIDSRTSDLLYKLILERRRAGVSFFIASHQALDVEKVSTDQRFIVSEGTIQIAQE